MKTVTITQEDYDEILERLMWLDALEAAGVDNWEGHDVAVEIFQEWSEQ